MKDESAKNINKAPAVFKRKLSAGGNRKFFLKIYGCQMNVSDAEAVAGMLIKSGYSLVDSEDKADIIFLVTCSVRDMAEQKVIGKLGFIAKRKVNNPDMIIGVLGCMAQNWKEKLVEKLPFVDIVCGPKDLLKLPDMIDSVIESRQKIIAVDGEEGSLDTHVPKLRQNNLSAWVPVMRGCNNFCSYCIVPYVRGREISREPEDVVLEIKNLTKEGYREVVLLGQNVNSYGEGLNKKTDFSDLLTMVNEIENIKRIRFVTSHPKDISEKLIKAMAQLDKVCEYLHFPAQSGSNRILKLMNRKYTREHYLNISKKLRNKIPEIALSS
ncbi:tRNA (N6-isopentenyl adenosine(37)-C2)-methylthiotransferase MiaB, partial [Chlamydiota bacterium]